MREIDERNPAVVDVGVEDLVVVEVGAGGLVDVDGRVGGAADVGADVGVGVDVTVVERPVDRCVAVGRDWRVLVGSVLVGPALDVWALGVPAPVGWVLVASVLVVGALEIVRAVTVLGGAVDPGCPFAPAAALVPEHPAAAAISIAAARARPRARPARLMPQRCQSEPLQARAVPSRS